MAINKLLAATAAHVGYWQNARAQRPDLRLNWNYQPFEQDIPRRTANVSTCCSDHFRHLLAVLVVDGDIFDDHLLRTDGKPALAVNSGGDKWYAGVVPEGELGETGNASVLQRAVAIHVGVPALREVQLGIIDDGEYTPFDTDALDFRAARVVRREYPDVPLLGLPPVEFDAMGADRSC
jgi:hypothetical protein